MFILSLHLMFRTKVRLLRTQLPIMSHFLNSHHHFIDSRNDFANDLHSSQQNNITIVNIYKVLIQFLCTISY